MLPQGGRRARQGHVGHLPGAPVREGGAVLHLRGGPGEERRHAGGDGAWCLQEYVPLGPDHSGSIFINALGGKGFIFSHFEWSVVSTYVFTTDTELLYYI